MDHPKAVTFAKQAKNDADKFSAFCEILTGFSEDYAKKSQVPDLLEAKQPKVHEQPKHLYTCLTFTN